ncbi:hypothetical protein LIQ99_11650 [Weissella cibaria]|uniref:hypothetical protein n=1 Tax=Weissella cibaria TaxID=137591 RepID=UPI001D047532|nr:hypothetical protein [Weissella cibaria]MCB5827550.1 hypothetical protein [Weissella cibaria]MCB5858069.1 hypothetical protein [Weissella cibaria]MCB5860295.1 hypothetical protein [Weissella cibaria]MCB5862713.1 hypothetical protein [Weissella cibaria]MCB5864812.1 hypothetical protein [Weissella cibaria]
MTDYAVGYAIFAIVGLVVFMAWLLDFMEQHEVHVRPMIEQRINELTEEKEDVDH